MSKDSHIKAYIIGFILSLVFTFIPYFLVVNQTVKGNVLLGTIMTFAVLQMLVQIIFFLHLGRNPKMRWQIGFFVATVFAILVVVLGSIIIIGHLHRNMTPQNITDTAADNEAIHKLSGEQVGTCTGEGVVDHKVTLTNTAISPLHTQAKLCDTITIVNESDSVRAIMYGTHDQLEPYAGETGETIRSGRNKQVVLTQSGTYQFHDHNNRELQGTFTVAP